jgi:uncharacterized coiled-coil DUF342 family protein
LLCRNSNAPGTAKSIGNATNVNHLHQQSREFYKQYCDELHANLQALQQEQRQLQTDLKTLRANEDDMIVRIKGMYAFN